jgi:hypothetical protein
VHELDALNGCRYRLQSLEVRQGNYNLLDCPVVMFYQVLQVLAFLKGDYVGCAFVQSQQSGSIGATFVDELGAWVFSPMAFL